MGTLLRCLLCAVVITAAVWTKAANADTPPSAITIVVEKGQVKSGEDVKLRVIMKNISHKAYETGYDEPATSKFRVFVQKGNGDTPRKTREEQEIEDDQHGFNLGGSNGLLDVVRPGETREYELTVNELYDMNDPGEYVMRVSLGGNSGKYAEVLSNLVRVEVTQ